MNTGGLENMFASLFKGAPLRFMVMSMGSGSVYGASPSRPLCKAARCLPTRLRPPSQGEVWNTGGLQNSFASLFKVVPLRFMIMSMGSGVPHRVSQHVWGLLVKVQF